MGGGVRAATRPGGTVRGWCVRLRALGARYSRSRALYGRAGGAGWGRRGRRARMGMAEGSRPRRMPTLRALESFLSRNKDFQGRLASARVPAPRDSVVPRPGAVPYHMRADRISLDAARTPVPWTRYNWPPPCRNVDVAQSSRAAPGLLHTCPVISQHPHY